MNLYDQVEISREFEVDPCMADRVLTVYRAVVARYGDYNIDCGIVSDVMVVRSHDWRAEFTIEEEDDALRLLVTRLEWQKD